MPAAVPVLSPPPLLLVMGVTGWDPVFISSFSKPPESLTLRTSRCRTLRRRSHRGRLAGRHGRRARCRTSKHRINRRTSNIILHPPRTLKSRVVRNITPRYAELPMTDRTIPRERHTRRAILHVGARLVGTTRIHAILQAVGTHLGKVEVPEVSAAVDLVVLRQVVGVCRSVLGRAQ